MDLYAKTNELFQPGLEGPHHTMSWQGAFDRLRQLSTGNFLFVLVANRAHNKGQLFLS